MEISQVSQDASQSLLNIEGMRNSNSKGVAAMNGGGFMDIIQQLFCGSMDISEDNEKSALAGEYANMLNALFCMTGNEDGVNILSNSGTSLLQGVADISQFTELIGILGQNYSLADDNAVQALAGKFLFEGQNILDGNAQWSVSTESFQPMNDASKISAEVIKASVLNAEAGKTDAGEKTSTMNFDFYRNIQQVKQNMSEDVSKSTTGAIDVDSLQASSDSFDVKSAMLVGSGNISEGEAVAKQVFDGIGENIGQGKNEFSIKLRPEGLGEVIVKLVQDGGKTVLSLTASSAKTAALLSSNLADLQTALSQHNVQLADIGEVKSVPHMAADSFMQQEYYGSGNGGQAQNRNYYSSMSDYFDVADSDDATKKSAEMILNSGLNILI